jgi:hypothetical protein
MLYSNNERVCATPRRNMYVHTIVLEIPFSIGYIQQFALDIRANRGLMHRDLFINTP